MAVAALPDTLIDELVAICGEAHVFTGRSALFNRARVPSPFPAQMGGVHPGRRPAHGGGADLGGREAREPRARPRRAARWRDRAHGRAVPLSHGILVDVKLMNKILEIDIEDRTVTVQPGINMLKLSQELQPLGFIYRTTPRRTRARSSAGGSARAAGR